MEEMKTGIVKFYDDSKGFGFITPDDGSDDIFLHVSQLEGITIDEGDSVEYDEYQGTKGLIAINVRLAD